MQARYAYLHTWHPCAGSFTRNASVQGSQNDIDFDPDMVTDEGTATNQYTICSVEMQLTFILKATVACGAILAVMISIDR